MTEMNAVGFGPLPMPWERRREKRAMDEARRILELATDRPEEYEHD